MNLQGLPNIDLSCSLNALIQVMAQTPQLKSVLTTEEGQHSSLCNVLALLINDINGTSKERSNRDIESDLKWIRRQLYKADSYLSQDLQNDSHVLFINLMNGLIETGAKEVAELFQIEILDLIECNICSYVDITTDQIAYSLAIPLCKKNMTVNAGIDCLFREEIMSLECRKCRTKDSTRQMCLKRLPVILVLQLPRVQKDSAGRLKKVKEFIQYQTKITMTDAANKSFDYELYGIIEHFGEIDEGHYIAHVLKCYPGHVRCWYRCSDENVSLNLTATRINDAYLLFYVKI